MGTGTVDTTSVTVSDEAWGRLGAWHLRLGYAGKGRGCGITGLIVQTILHNWQVEDWIDARPDEIKAYDLPRLRRATREARRMALEAERDGELVAERMRTAVRGTDGSVLGEDVRRVVKGWKGAGGRARRSRDSAAKRVTSSAAWPIWNKVVLGGGGGRRVRCLSRVVGDGRIGGRIRELSRWFGIVGGDDGTGAPAPSVSGFIEALGLEWLKPVNGVPMCPTPRKRVWGGKRRAWELVVPGM